MSTDGGLLYLALYPDLPLRSGPGDDWELPGVCASVVDLVGVLAAVPVVGLVCMLGSVWVGAARVRDRDSERLVVPVA